MNKFKDCSLLKEYSIYKKDITKTVIFGLNYQRRMCTSVSTIARFLGSKIKVEETRL